MKSWAAGILLSAGALSLPATGEWPVWIEGWLYNPRERSEQTVSAWEMGRFEDAATAAATARRLTPEDPHAHFNAGTSELAAGRRPEAVESLEQAVALISSPGSPSTTAPISPAIHYNLGIARYDSGDPTGAVASFEQALRLDPDFDDAKFNLELALRELEQRQTSPRSGGLDPGRDPEADQDTTESPGGGSREPSESESEQDPRPDRSQVDAESPDPAATSRLPHFEDQPDMSAEEAVAILEAVTSLERQQRREQALERARRRRQGDKDW